MSSEPPLVVINGPTASGKSQVAVEVAWRLADAGRPAEIVNADSMLVYRGMDIGTAKPTMAERRGVPHHLLDIWDVTVRASVATFQHLARTAIAECRSRGVVPILVGGSALYVHAVIDHFDFPGTDPEVRARLEERCRREGVAALFAEVQRRAPHAARVLEPGNERRVVRALEVLELRERPRGALPEFEQAQALEGVVQVGLDLPREVLDARIAARVDRMWRYGLVDEVRALEARGLRQGVTASRAIGYRQVLQMFDGEFDEATARDRVESGTRRLARRQLSWFRRDARVEWLDAADPGTVGAIVAHLS